MISTAILAAEYAVCHPVFPPRTAAPSLDVSWVRAMAVDEVVSALVSRVVRFRASSAGGVGVEMCAFDLRRRGIAKVDDQINLIMGLILGTPMIGGVAPALDITSRSDSRSEPKVSCFISGDPFAATASRLA